MLRMDGQTNVEDTLLDLAAFHHGDAGNIQCRFVADNIFIFCPYLKKHEKIET